MIKDRCLDRHVWPDRVKVSGSRLQTIHATATHNRILSRVEHLADMCSPSGLMVWRENIWVKVLVLTIWHDELILCVTDHTEYLGIYPRINTNVYWHNCTIVYNTPIMHWATLGQVQDETNQFKCLTRFFTILGDERFKTAYIWYCCIM